jgi:hypothetical protein
LPGLFFNEANGASPQAIIIAAICAIYVSLKKKKRNKQQ